MLLGPILCLISLYSITSNSAVSVYVAFGQRACMGMSVYGRACPAWHRHDTEISNGHAQRRSRYSTVRSASSARPAWSSRATRRRLKGVMAEAEAVIKPLCGGACAETIAAFHGSQCGFCTPGMVVACHAAVAKARAAGGEPGPEAMEKALDGNLCRCTGYRPILDACKVPVLAPLPSPGGCPHQAERRRSTCTGHPGENAGAPLARGRAHSTVV